LNSDQGNFSCDERSISAKSDRSHRPSHPVLVYGDENFIGETAAWRHRGDKRHFRTDEW